MPDPRRGSRPPPREGRWPTIENTSDDPNKGLGAILVPSSDHRELRPVSVAEPAPSAELLAGATADWTEWRLLELWSDQGLPWEATVEWSGSQATGQIATFTVPGSARFCCAATSIKRIKAVNLTAKAHIVRVAVGSVDSTITCRNHRMYPIAAGGGIAGFVDIEIPPYGERLYVTPSDPLAFATTTVDLFDPLGALIASYTLTQQPAAGQPVTGCTVARIHPPVGVRCIADIALGV